LRGWRAARNANGTVSRSFAAGAVQAGNSSYVGGLVGFINPGAVQQSYASGPVNGGSSSFVGGLVGGQINGTLSEAYAVGPVSGLGATGTGGLIGGIGSAPTVTNSYWDENTTGQATSAGGLGTAKTTSDLRATLPAGFGKAWAINKTLSYPFLNFDADFTSPLATLVLANNVYVFVPISQLDVSQYKTKPNHDDAAALAAVYTMIARGIGITDDVAALKNVKIDKYFWDDATQQAVWTGPVTTHATLGVLKNLSGQITNTNVIAQIKAHRLVILRGTYSVSGGGTATHWMLATLDTKNPDNSIGIIVANDPWTGWQVEIDPASKTVVLPANYPLSNFTVDGYQSVTID
jgi:hypothetical protein